MKIALLSGADKNAGDFLIVERADALLRHYLPQAEIKHFRRNRSLEPCIDEINECDYFIFAGGPGYVQDMYPGRFPLVDDLDRIKPKMIALGMGCYGRDSRASYLNFNETSRKLLNRLEHDGFGLGCRDLLTYKVLSMSGFESAIMTGCPAWYDLDYINNTEVINPVPVSQIKQIAVSDPGNEDNYEAAKKLLVGLKIKFPNASIQFVFHRGWSADKYTNSNMATFQDKLKNWCEQNSIPTQNIAYSSEGFSVYDECDLHIGFRVHAHIYSLSHRRPSFLLEEDGRGFGLNESLGLSHFSLFCSYPIHVALVLGRKFLKSHLKIRSVQEKKVVNLAIEQAVAQIENGYTELHDAYKKMKDTYGCMSEQICQLLND